MSHIEFIKFCQNHWSLLHSDNTHSFDCTSWRFQLCTFYVSCSVMQMPKCECRFRGSFLDFCTGWRIHISSGRVVDQDPCQIENFLGWSGPTIFNIIDFNRKKFSASYVDKHSVTFFFWNSLQPNDVLFISPPSLLIKSKAMLDPEEWLETLDPIRSNWQWIHNTAKIYVFWLNLFGLFLYVPGSISQELKTSCFDF